jgi:omega-amidase
MKIVTFQIDLVWENTEKNLQRIEEKLLSCEEEADVWVLPEMFTSGFSMNPEAIVNSTDEHVLNWMKDMAKLKQGCVVGSVAFREDGKYFNRLLWVFPDGTCAKYDKRHLFRMAGEDVVYSAGSEPLIVQYKGCRFMPLICYDIRFPMWSRNVQFDNGEPEFRYDCAIYVANWPSVRSRAWLTLLQARAIENLCYTIGVNRVGEDGNGVLYEGNSRVFDAKGNRLDSHSDGEENYSVVQLNLVELAEFRKVFPAHRDADHFILKPGIV